MTSPIGSDERNIATRSDIFDCRRDTSSPEAYSMEIALGRGPCGDGPQCPVIASSIAPSMHLGPAFMLTVVRVSGDQPFSSRDRALGAKTYC